MTETLEERLKLAEKRIDEFAKKPRDAWDIFQIIASLLVPASITIAGFEFSQASKEAEIRSAEAIATHQQEAARLQIRVGQGQLISTYMDALLSTDTHRQKLAIEGVLVALPEEGPHLLAALSADQSNPDAQRMAASSLDMKRTQLIADCFNKDKPVRITAVAELIQGWQDDQQLVPELVAAASKNTADASGVINALVVLENVSLRVLLPNADQVKRFAESVKSIGPQTAGHVANVEDRLK